MKKIICLLLVSISIASCNKDAVKPLNQVEIKIIHNTCVQTIAKVITPNSNIGVSFTKNGLIYTNCFNLGVKNLVRIDSVNQILTVNVLSTATNPQVICAMADIAGTTITHDIEKP